MLVWQDRVAELERKAREKAEEKTLESMDAMTQRHLKYLKVLQGKALEALRTMPLKSAMDAVRTLDVGIRQQRVVRGEPSERTATTIEDTIRKEYERWMVVEEEESDERKHQAVVPE